MKRLLTKPKLIFIGLYFSWLLCEPDVGGQHCQCLVFVRISGKSCPVSVCCPDSVRIFYPVSVCPDFVCLDSVRIFIKTLSVVCLSGRTRTRQSCPCPPTSNFELTRLINLVSNSSLKPATISKLFQFHKRFPRARSQVGGVLENRLKLSLKITTLNIFIV